MMSCDKTVCDMIGGGVYIAVIIVRKLLR